MEWGFSNDKLIIIVFRSSHRGLRMRMARRMEWQPVLSHHVKNCTWKLGLGLIFVPHWYVGRCPCFWTQNINSSRTNNVHIIYMGLWVWVTWLQKWEYMMYIWCCMIKFLWKMQNMVFSFLISVFCPFAFPFLLLPPLPRINPKHLSGCQLKRRIRIRH